MTEHHVFVSIVMPLYNAEKYLAETLSLIGQQTFQEYELLLIDALSDDGTEQIAKEAIGRNDKIRWFSQKDNGIYDAMNFGIEKARGQWLYFMGSDDSFAHLDVLSQLCIYLSEDCDIVYGDVQWVPDGEAETGQCTPISLYTRNINHQRIFYRRSLFKRFDKYDLKYKIASDYELNIRFFCNDQIKTKYLPFLIANYHSGGYSAQKQDEIFWSEWSQIFKASFLKHMPLKKMYEKIGWYCRYLIEKRQYKKAAPLFWDVLINTWSPGFVWLTFRHIIRSFRIHAS